MRTGARCRARHLVDVREPFELEICSIPGSLHIPMADLPGRTSELPDGVAIVLYCHTGVRSLYATHYLRANGIESVWSLRGGIDLWARELDPAMKRY